MSSLKRCWNQQTKQWEACKNTVKTSKGGTGTPVQCCIPPACCLSCADFNEFLSCIINIPPIPSLNAPTPVVQGVQYTSSLLEFVQCRFGMNRATGFFSFPDYTTPPVVTYSPVPCYDAEVFITNETVPNLGIWVRQCLIITSTSIDCPTMGVCYEVMSTAYPPGPFFGGYFTSFRNPKLCLNPNDYSIGGLPCDNCAQQPPTP